MWRWGHELIVGGIIITACLLFIILLKIFTRKNEIRRSQQLPYLRSIDPPPPSPSPQRKKSLMLRAFDWNDYPALMSEAGENGWAAFALSQVNPKSRFAAEISWEIGPGTEFMQVIRSNPGVSEISMQSMQFFKSALPIPGPFLGPYSYPQEAYFEITFLSPPVSIDDQSARLIRGNSSRSLSDRISAIGRIKSSRLAPQNGDPLFSRVLAIGLVSGGNSSFGDAGSIAYYSTGQILLNGKIFVDDRFKKKNWVPVRSDTTVGCGFNPRLRKVFFTLNGEIICHVNCINAEEFGYPLHVGFICNYDATAIVNLGQALFESSAENARRNSDPGNHRPPPLQRSPGQYDSSGDLFSVGSQRLDYETGLTSPALSQDLMRRPAAPPSEAESELFEIGLDEEKIIRR